MLSLERCREILGDEAPADDRQLEIMREEAYRLARLLIEAYRAQRDAKNPPAGSPPDPKI
jgi:hypothetical protein